MNKQNNIPKLRFPEFKGEFSEYRLSELMDRYSQNNKDEEFGIDDILSLSSTFGIVDRKELLEDTYDKVNHKNYKKTRLNDFVYGKSISASFPYGLFKVNNCRDGLLSSLYFTFKVYKNINPSYLDIYFSYQNRANNFLKRFVLVGDRYITADANYLLSGKISIPTLPEQTRIASFFTTIDQKLSQLKQKKTLLEQYKKGVMQKLFSQELRFKDVPSTSSGTGVAVVEPVETTIGKEFPKWQKKQLGKIGETYNGLTGKTKEDFGEGKPYIQYKQIFDNTKIDVSKFDFVGINENENQNRAKYGDVFFTTSSETPLEIGYSSVLLDEIEELYLNSFCFGYRINSFKELSPLFAQYLFRSPIFRKEVIKLGQGSTRYNMSKVELMKIDILLPCEKEQEKISSFMATIDDKIFRTINQIQQTQEWKKGLLQRMFV